MLTAGVLLRSLQILHGDHEAHTFKCIYSLGAKRFHSTLHKVVSLRFTVAFLQTNPTETTKFSRIKLCFLKRTLILIKISENALGGPKTF